MSRYVALLAVLCSTAAFAERGALGDPTRPTTLNEPPSVAVTRGPAPRWLLQSTLVSNGRRLAVINGKALREGEVVAGGTVVEIRSDGVTLNAAGRTVVLRMTPQVADIRKRESKGERR